MTSWIFMIPSSSDHSQLGDENCSNSPCMEIILTDFIQAKKLELVQKTRNLLAHKSERVNGEVQAQQFKLKTEAQMMGSSSFPLLYQCLFNTQDGSFVQVAASSLSAILQATPVDRI